MATNDLIRVPDYNDIFNIINPVLGTGTGNRGYGQTTLATAVNTNSRVSKTQWDNLRYDIINAIAHQTGSPPTIVEANEGDLVQYDANLPNFQYLTLASQANTNRFNIAVGRYAVEPSIDVDSFVTFYGTVTAVVVATWPSANDARAFFNSGGRIQLSSTFDPFKTTPQNDDWQSLLNVAGTFYFDGNNGVNFYSLTNVDKTVDEQRGSSYTQNIWRISARSNVANNSNGGATQVIITSSWIDGYSENSSTLNNQPPREGVSGQLTLTVTQRRAYAALYPNLISGSFQGPKPTWAATDFTVTNPGERPLGPAQLPDPGSANAFIYPASSISYILNSNLPKPSIGSFTIEHENKAGTNGSYVLTLITSPAGSVVTTSPPLGSTITLGPNQSQVVNYTVTSPLGSYPDVEFVYEIEITDAEGNTYNPKHTHTQIRVLNESDIP